VAEAIRALAGAKVNILSILGWNDSGTSLLKYLEKLAGQGINLQSIGGITSKKATKAVVVWTSQAPT
jgi:hypothetical protein